MPLGAPILPDAKTKAETFANQHFRRYNADFTTKRAGNYRPFFLVNRFWCGAFGLVSSGLDASLTTS